MKQIIRGLIIMILTVAIAFSAAFPQGIIAFKNGTEVRVKKVYIEDNFVFYKFKGEQKSALLDDVDHIKARGKITRLVGNITGGTSALFFGYGAVRIWTGQAQVGPTDIGAQIYYIAAAGTTTLLYFGGRLIGSVFDPMHKIYTATVPE